jgi:hypothetical protein
MYDLTIRILNVIKTGVKLSLLLFVISSLPPLPALGYIHAGRSCTDGANHQ